VSSGGPRHSTAGHPAHFDREEALARLGREQFDLLVIGGGVTGAGVALDAASRGLRTALVEKGDFASGTSSRSSKLVHGGLRYLQQREFRLVYESLAERQRLLRNAPHLVTRLPFLIPLFGRHGVASKAVARSVSAALWMYDLTGGLRIGARHRRLTREEVVRHVPLLETDRLVAGYLYEDARTDDARLTLAILRTASLDYGAVVANYAPVHKLVTDRSGTVVGAVVKPATAGSASDPGPDRSVATDPLVVWATVVINATGVWADEVASLGTSADVASLGTSADVASLGTSADVASLGTSAHPSLVPAKGVHVAVPAHRLPCDIAAVIPVGGDRRSIFVVPWPEEGLVYLGTTDTPYSGSLDHPRATPDDVAYLLDAANRVTTADLVPGDVTAVWAGLRPLLAPGSGRRVNERTADLSRRHHVVVGSNNLITITGGKLTTYRKMAQDAVDAARNLLPDSVRPGRCVTKGLALRGSERWDSERGGGGAGGGGSFDRIDQQRRSHLIARYGREASQVVAVADDRPELLEPVIEDLPYLGAEIVYAARAEMAQTLMDVAARRTRALVQRVEPTVAAAPRLASLLASELGWSPAREAAEVDVFRTEALAGLAAAGLAPSSSSEDAGDRR
jgi:glycerol-3-phosphate dehydrogenase